MKKLLTIFSIIMSFALTSCSSYYIIAEETQPVPSMKNYKTIFIGWIPIAEDNWKEYGYETKNQFSDVVRSINVESLPQYSKEIFKNRTVIIAQKKDSKAPNTADLQIRFTSAQYRAYTTSKEQIDQTLWGTQAGHDILDLQISIIDLKTKKEIYKTHAGINSKGGGFSDMRFEGRVGNTVYNTLLFLNTKMAQ